jgi:flagellar biosynthetic protein FliQ
MTPALVIDMARNALMLALMLGGPLLLVALAVGVAVSVFQAVTQIQEQTVGFVLKLTGVGIVFLLTLNWMIQAIVRYTIELFNMLPSLAS